MARVLLADDNAMIRTAVKALLREDLGMEWIGEASTGDETLRKALPEDYDLLLLAMTLGSSNGLQILRTLREWKRRLPVLMSSLHPEDEYIVASLQAGAAGYLDKGASPEELVAAVRKVSHGGFYLAPDVAEHIVGQLDCWTRATTTIVDDKPRSSHHQTLHGTTRPTAPTRTSGASPTPTRPTTPRPTPGLPSSRSSGPSRSAPLHPGAR